MVVREFRRGAVLAVVVLLLAPVLFVYSLLPNVAYEYELNQLRVGMTREEVVAVIGRPDEISVMSVPPGERWDYAVFGGYGVIVHMDEYGRFQSWDNW